MSLTLRVPAESAFGEYIRSWPGPGRERASDHLFGVAQAINRRGVDPVHAQLERSMNRGHGVVVILFSPGELPARAANGPGPVAHRRDKEIGISKLFRFHMIKCSMSHNSLSMHDAFQIPKELFPRGLTLYSSICYGTWVCLGEPNGTRISLAGQPSFRRSVEFPSVPLKVRTRK